VTSRLWTVSLEFCQIREQNEIIFVNYLSVCSISIIPFIFTSRYFNVCVPSPYIHNNKGQPILCSKCLLQGHIRKSCTSTANNWLGYVKMFVDMGVFHPSMFGVWFEYLQEQQQAQAQAQTQS